MTKPVYEIIQQILADKSLTIAEAARVCNLPDSTLRGIIARKQKTIALEVAFKIAQGLGISLEALNGMDSGQSKFTPAKIDTKITSIPEELVIIKKYRDLDDHGKKLVNLVLGVEHERCIEPPEEDEEEQPTILLPAYWNKASAGEGYDLDTDECDELQILLNERTRKADMIISVQGDSMEPRYHDGDKVLVRKQPEVELGQVGIFRVGTMGYIKERGPDRLISINPNYEDVYIGEEEECVCIGKVMGVLENDWIVG